MKDGSNMFQCGNFNCYTAMEIADKGFYLSDIAAKSESAFAIHEVSIFTHKQLHIAVLVLNHYNVK